MQEPTPQIQSSISKPENGTGFRTLVIHPSLAPYRVDLFNRLNGCLELEVVFQRPQVSYNQSFNQKSLRNSLACRYSDLEGNVTIFKRDLPWGIPALIRNRKAEVIVTSEFSLVSIFVILARKFGGIRCGHVIWSDENTHTLARHGRIRHGLRRYCSRRVDALIMCSEEVSREFARCYALDPRRIFQCAVHQAPEAIRARLAASKTISREKISVHNLADKKIVAFVGRLTKVKNLPMAVQAFSRAFQDDNSTVFVFVGTGEEREKLEQLGESLGIGKRLVFVGHHEQNELYSWYRIASMLVLPSVYDPYGAVVNEALVCGVHVACSDHAGAARLIREGVNGYTFSPFDCGGLANRFRQLAPLLSTAESLVARERDDLMPLSFENDVHGFLSAVRYAAQDS